MQADPSLASQSASESSVGEVGLGSSLLEMVLDQPVLDAPEGHEDAAKKPSVAPGSLERFLATQKRFRGT